MIARSGKPQRRELEPQPLRGLQGLRHGRIRHQVGEFLAAEPAEQIARADRRAGEIAEGLQHPIASLMAGRVVDVLEAVEIEQQQRRRPAFGDGALEQRSAEIEKRAPVGDAGQRIGLRRLPLLEFGALLRHADAQEGRQKATNSASNAITNTTASCAWPLLTEAAKSCA